ncbi:type II toxin-antitoxin system HicA family toxin [Novispirillum sp. DQ9]|uniref:type II toxin-antitoxin system HicA family toxin n=1 Tax=Novispirillum sp. DQ9 TaxID=3398612 RepID=UPI003C7CA687
MLSSRDVIRKLKDAGWVHVGTTGDHFHFKHPERPGKVTVPHPKKDLTLKTLRSIEAQSGIRLR